MRPSTVAVSIAALFCVVTLQLSHAQTSARLVRIDDMIVDTGRIVPLWGAGTTSADGPKGAIGLSVYNAIPWPGGVTAIEFASEITQAQRTQFMQMCATWSQFANVKCVPRTTEGPDSYLLVTGQTTGCWSTLGKDVRNQLNMDASCWNAEITGLHELGHSFGLMHEHQRSDRDNYVKINWTNIVGGANSNFDILSASVNHGPYDYLSLMHYSSTAFNGGGSARTIDPVPFDQTIANVMGFGSYRGGRVVPTAGDGNALASIYGPSTIVVPPVTYAVQVHVRDRNTGAAVTGVRLALNSFESTGDGSVQVRVVPGTYTVSISAPGYQPVALAGIQVTAPITATVTLTPAPTAPRPPVLTATQSTRNPIALDWGGTSLGVVTNYRILAGSSPGTSNVGVFDMGLLTSISTPIPPGSAIYVRVVAENTVGSATSNEVMLLVPAPGVPQPPTMLTPVVAGNTVTLQWAAANMADTSFILRARLSAAGPVVASVPVNGSTTLQVPGVGPGVYYVTVVTVNGSQTSGESNQMIVTVR